ncbi:hypothetical protein F5Y17DRAFT_411055 [Xylariaceae sp. FL0594]|nr:hypothetical protein F5Y17DRAFT_411055 [Xylariaceae sp. FL0594]
MSNMTALDKLWDDMDVNLGIIQLPKDEHMGHTQTFPWDQSRGLYMLDSYHTLHCLKNIYTYVRQQSSPSSSSSSSSIPVTPGHILHCIADIRLSVLCQADGTVLPFPGPETSPTSTTKRTCPRNWRDLEAYALRNSACFRRRDDGDPRHNTLYEYTDCPPSSPYRGVVASAFGG